MGTFQSLFVEIILASTVVLFLIYKYITRNYDYWKKRGVLQVEPIISLFSKSIGKQFRESSMNLYKKYRNERFVGTLDLFKPQLVIIDTELIKLVLTKDFGHFEDRALLMNLPHDFISKNLVHMEGDEWRRMRSKLSPTFTSGKMKIYFTLIEIIAKQLNDHLDPLAESNSTVDIKELIARFTTDVIASCAFGIEVNSINNPDNKIRKIGRLLIEPSFHDLLITSVYPLVPWLTRILPITQTNPVAAKFILNLLKENIDFRKKNNLVRNDFIDLLMKIKDKTLTSDKEDKDSIETSSENNKTNVGKELTLKEMAAQMSVFFAAGFETASSTTTFLLYELASHPFIQEKVRDEIKSVISKHDGQLTYQCLQEMRYLEKCIQETLRRYASLPFLSRKCVKAYKIPGSNTVINEGVKIMIPIYAIHHDPEYYPDPYRFDPERFSEGNVSARNQYTFLPFGEGPRICIGKRLGIMQVQMAAITLLKNYDLKLAPSVPSVLPISSSHVLTTPEIPVELIISKRKT